MVVDALLAGSPQAQGTDFAIYRIRALLYAGKPDWALLDTLTSTQIAESPLIVARFAAHVLEPQLLSGVSNMNSASMP